MTSEDSWLNSASRAEKERLLRSLLELKESRDRFRLSMFRPHPGFQEKFIQSVKPIRMCFTPNQEGKTTISAYEAACYALNEHPHKKIRVPNTGWIVTAKALKEGVEKDILPKFREIVGTDDIVDIRPNNQGVPHKIIWRSGSVTYLMSAEQDDRVFEGTTLDWAWFDEPFRRHIYIAVLRGLQKSGGHLWWSMTPLDEPWIYDEVYTASHEGKDKDIEIFEAQPGENKSIPLENREKFWSKLTEDEMQSRKFGKFAHLSGRVIKSYQPDLHRVPGFDIPKHWPVWLSIDPHRAKPKAVLFLTAAPTEVYYVCNEIFMRCEIKELGALIEELMSQYWMAEQLIDTSAQEEGWEKMSARELLQPFVKTKLAQKHGKEGSGIILLNQLFSENRLFVMDHCVRTHK